MVNEELKNFVKGALDKGEPKEKISAGLLANGWDHEDLNEVFNLLEKGIVPPVYNDLKPLPNGRSGVGKALIFFIILLVVSGGVFAVYRFGYLDSILNKEAVIVEDPNLPETPITPVTPTQNSEDPIMGWQTYTNTQYGFKFSYPDKNWMLDISTGPKTVGELFYVNVYKSLENAFMISIFDNSKGAGIDEWLATSYRPFKTYPPDKVTKNDVPLATETRKFKMSNLGFNFEHIIIKKDRYYYALILTDNTNTPTVEEDIFKSFKFTNSNLSLPPGPGEAGKQTLEGIDSDKDGIRDDMQIYISQTYPNSAKMRAALTQKIKTDQNFILNSKATDEILFSIVTARNRAQDCLNYINKDPNAVLKIQQEMRAQFLNTKARSIAYVEADARLSGIFWPSPDRTKNSCDFDPDQLPN